MSTSTTTAVSKTSKTALVITSFPSVPLTTTFTRPSSDCGALYSPRRPPLYIIDNEPSCLPPGFSTSNSAFFYSPGIACPSGYWTACHDTTGVSSITTVTCCPTYRDITLSCVPNPLSLSEVWESLFCTWIAPRSTGTEVIVTKSVDGRTSTVTERVTWPGGINAYGVRMVYQSTDLEIPVTSTSTSTTLSSDGPTRTGDTSPDPSSSKNTASADTGLSTGAKAAIGVVVPLVVLGALLAALLFWRRKRKHQQQSPPMDHQQQPQPGLERYPLGDQHPKPPGSTGGGYYYYGGTRPQPQAQEMGGNWETASELPSTRAAVELPGETPSVVR
jgi:hypothetical protein